TCPSAFTSPPTPAKIRSASGSIPTSCCAACSPSPSSRCSPSAVSAAAACSRAFPRSQLQLAAVASVAPGRSLGARRRCLRAATEKQAERLFPAPVRRVHRARRSGRQQRRRAVRQRQPGFLHRLSARRLALSRGGELFSPPAARRRGQAKNSLGQLRGLLRHVS